ncbi:MAG: 1-acyl-sn-glycerol-3-phosphate acyltransferase [Oscillospiraceae bacterium]|nr:1-acyl-sn-glycerol-3-phosphate acyltransferase [Oscillospiraceae bacterium]
MSEQFDTKAYYALWAKRLTPIVKILYPFTVYGEENILEKPCLICANHSNYIDPILVALAFGGHRPIHFMAKIELFKHKRFGAFLGKLGAFGVDRDGADISAIRTVMKYIRAGETVGIFPEGTRVSTDGAVEAKTGAARMAAKLRVPIVPVFVSRRKWVFRKVKIVIGKPIEIPADTEDFQRVTNELMEQIAQMGRNVV